MLWESEPNAENRARLNSMGVESLVINPCGNRPVTGDFLSVMQLNLRELKRIYTQRTLKQSTSPPDLPAGEAEGEVL